MMKRRKHKFKVNLTIQELSSVPLVSGVLFAKIREDHSKVNEFTDRVEVKNHVVKWNKQIVYECKLHSNTSSGVLEECLCRISIRKETHGGLSHTKLGYVDLNMSEFAGHRDISRSNILQGYTSKHRLDNSVLRFTVTMTVISGDPLFKTPTLSPSLDSDLIIDRPELRGQNPDIEQITPASDGSGKNSYNSLSNGLSDSAQHSRNASLDSDQLKQSNGFNTVPKVSSSHTRAASLDIQSGHTSSSVHSTPSRNPSSGSSNFASLRSTRDTRIGSTKIAKFDSQNVVDELFNNVDIEETEQTRSLQLYVNAAGVATVTGHDNPPSGFMRVET